MNIKTFIDELNLGERITLAGSLIAVFSLFMDWVDIGFLSADGFQQGGYYMLIFIIYPFVKGILRQPIKKWIAVPLSALSVVFMFFFIMDKSTDFFGTSVNLAASGMYVMLLALLAVFFGAVLNNRTKDNSSEVMDRM